MLDLVGVGEASLEEHCTSSYPVMWCGEGFALIAVRVLNVFRFIDRLNQGVHSDSPWRSACFPASARPNSRHPDDRTVAQPQAYSQVCDFFVRGLSVVLHSGI